MCRRNISMYYRRSRKSKVIAIVTVILVILITIPMCSNYYSEKSYKITVTGKEVKNSIDDSKYLIFAKTENGETKTFSIEDNVIKWRWNSSDVYGDVEIGKTYEIKVIGWRIPIISSYENIMKIKAS